MGSHRVSGTVATHFAVFGSVLIRLMPHMLTLCPSMHNQDLGPKCSIIHVIRTVCKQSMVHGLALACRDGIAKYSFGEATVHKASDSHPDCYILNGQLDLTKIQAMFPQAVFHFQESRGELREIPRIEVRQLQQEFFATYISPAVDNLGCFWDEHGRLQKRLAGRDTINGRFMDVAHAFKQVRTVVPMLASSPAII